MMNLPGFTAEPDLIVSGDALFAASASATVPFASEFSIPCIYGKYCGPGCTGTGDAVDDVDDCCRRHDDCYERKGYFACSCDSALLKCIKNKQNIWTKKGRAAIAVYQWFYRQPCIWWK